MNKYGISAIKAVENFNEGISDSPIAAWNKAVIEVFGVKSENARKKACPKCAFLGLCEDGLIKGIPKGNYTRSKKNKIYAIKAINIIKDTPIEKYDEKSLWSKVMNEDKKHNSQMSVVLALWNKDYIEE